MSTSRATIREQLAVILNTALVGTSKPCQAVYDYQPATFSGQSPVVTVSGAGSMRTPFTMQGNRLTAYLYIHVFTLYADADSGWTESDAEDRMDLIEKTIAETLQTYRKHTGYWINIAYSEPSQESSAEIGGDEYRIEVITVAVEAAA